MVETQDLRINMKNSTYVSYCTFSTMEPYGNTDTFNIYVVISNKDRNAEIYFRSCK